MRQHRTPDGLDESESVKTKVSGTEYANAARNGS